MKSIWLRVALGIAGLALVLGIIYFGAGLGWWGRYEGPGRIAGSTPHQTPAMSDRRQILFGDLHVHTTFSTDAFFTSLPMLQGKGSHPPADAVDFARYCSALDFWSITDHAEGLTPQRWNETIETVRQANAMAGDPANPDMVVFLGWEWTNIAFSAAEHYGHKNVILRDIDQVPTRPIASMGNLGGGSKATSVVDMSNLAFIAPGERQRYFDMARFLRERAGVADCPAGLRERDMPKDCFEAAMTPRDLFSRLDDWGFPSMVIPHGNSWGLYTPADASWDKQLKADQNDPKYQFLVEVFSGHGNSEEYRDWRPVVFDKDSKAICPPPRPDYLPECWQAGEIIRGRCQKAGESADTCESRAVEARDIYIKFGVAGFRTVPAQTAEDWLDAGQCRDCFRAAYGYRPMTSSQYALALTNFDDPAKPKHFEFGFIASSDNHQARPGTGYKQYSRDEITDGANGAININVRDVMSGAFGKQKTDPRAQAFDRSAFGGFSLANTERVASFMSTGGLVAVHANGRDRNAIWDGLQRKEVYGTSGDRIQLWFDLVNGPNGERHMGATETMTAIPRFSVQAIGAFRQKPGCPEDSLKAVSKDRLEKLCRGECYNPSDERKMITRIEIIRIRPQTSPGEDMQKLIQDPWKRFDCKLDQAGCTAEFDDPEYPASGRPATYYARAIEEPRMVVNAANLRCEKDDKGNCIKVNPCYGDYRTEQADSCLAMSEEKAWSSPIYLYPRAQ